MVRKRILSVAILLTALTACGEVPTSPQPMDADLLVAAADPGNGAIVSRFFANQLILVTADPSTGLGTVHYGSATHVASQFPGCVVPAYEGGGVRQVVHTPNGKQQDQSRSEVYVVVLPLDAGFPFSACGGRPLAEGPIAISIVGSSGPPGTGVLNISSNGALTDNSDGSSIRLHHTFQRRVGVPDRGTVALR